MRLYRRIGLCSVAASALTVVVLAVANGAAKSPPATAIGHHLVAVDGSTGRLIVPAFPDYRWALTALADNAGGWYVGGCHLVRLHHDGTPDDRFKASMPRFGKYGFCTASLATDGSTLYAAGNLGVVAFDAATGARRWSVGVAGGEASQVALGRAVAYIVGDFTRVGGVARRGLAALDARTGKLMSWTVALDSVPGPQPAFVTAIAVSGGTVYVGGYFKGVGGKVQPNLAAVSAATGRAIGRAPMRRTAAPDASRGIVVSHRLLIAGHDTLVAVDTRSGKPARWPNAIRGSAYIFSVGGDTLYMGSDIRYGFERAGGRPANNLAAVRLPDGPVLPWRPILAPYTIIESLAASRGTVIVIGEFLRTIS